MNNSPIDEVLSRLDNVSGSKGQYNAACPCRNDDKNPSLRIGIGREDQVLLKCLRGGGCSVGLRTAERSEVGATDIGYVVTLFMPALAAAWHQKRRCRRRKGRTA